MILFAHVSFFFFPIITLKLLLSVMHVPVCLLVFLLEVSTLKDLFGLASNGMFNIFCLFARNIFSDSVTALLCIARLHE